MAPKQVSRQQPGVASSIYNNVVGGLRDPETMTRVWAAAVFAGAITFLQSSYAEYLVPTF
ncbi:hypothetical protein PYCC9005_000339 [Savitreella phatthalungensis]